MYNNNENHGRAEGMKPDTMLLLVIVLCSLASFLSFTGGALISSDNAFGLVLIVLAGIICIAALFTLVSVGRKYKKRSS